MANKEIVGLRQARALNAAGWDIPTAYCWAYGPDRLLGKIWRPFHKTEDIHSIDKKDVLPAAPTISEMLAFIRGKLGKISEELPLDANLIAEYILKNKLLSL